MHLWVDHKNHLQQITSPKRSLLEWQKIIQIGPVEQYKEIVIRLVSDFLLYIWFLFQYNFRDMRVIYLWSLYLSGLYVWISLYYIKLHNSKLTKFFNVVWYFSRHASVICFFILSSSVSSSSFTLSSSYWNEHLCLIIILSFSIPALLEVN